MAVHSSQTTIPGTDTTATPPTSRYPKPEDTDALITKVAKLLTMAERTDNPEEADAFSRKAAQLIADHRLDPDRLFVERTGDPLEVWSIPIGRGAYVRARLRLIGVIAESHDCQMLYQSQATGTVALVFGFRSDLRAVEVLYTSLHAQASAQMARVTRATGAATQRWRRSFLFGFADTVGIMLAETTAETERALGPEVGSRLAPARLARERQVSDFVTQRFPKVGRARPSVSPYRAGYSEGSLAAKRHADLGRERLAARVAIGSGS